MNIVQDPDPSNIEPDPDLSNIDPYPDPSNFNPDPDPSNIDPHISIINPDRKHQCPAPLPSWRRDVLNIPIKINYLHAYLCTILLTISVKTYDGERQVTKPSFPLQSCRSRTEFL